MKYNIIAIDPSLISTALVVSSGDSFKIYNYCMMDKVFSKKGITKWFGLAEELITYRFIEYRKYKEYSEGELIKLKDYDKISDQIIEDILDNIDLKKPTKIGIEGYSFSSKNGAIIDLVAFSTILRKKLFDKITENILVLSPSTLKLESCKLTYPPINVGVKKEKWVYKNNLGISGGSFTKHSMLLAITENNNLTDFWAKHCKDNNDDIFALSSIPKPHEDCNDSYLIYNILKSQS